MGRSRGPARGPRHSAVEPYVLETRPVGIVYHAPTGRALGDLRSWRRGRHVPSLRPDLHTARPDVPALERVLDVAVERLPPDDGVARCYGCNVAEDG